jgi:predicted acyltransferase
MINTRNSAVDIFRGMTMVLMTIVNNPGSWDHVYPPLLHASWHGCTLTDLVFPFFIFIMCFTLSFSSKESLSFEKIGARALRIFCLGLFLNFFSKIHFLGLEGTPLMLFRTLLSIAVAIVLMRESSTKWKWQSALGLLLLMLVLAYSGLEDFKEVRIPGVLQRLALVYFFVALAYKFLSLNLTYLLLGICLFLYYLLMQFMPYAAGDTGSFEEGKNLAAALDHFLLKGHLWAVKKTWDPEGVLSTLPAIGSGLIGLLAGIWSLKKSKQKESLLLISGIVLLILGKVFSIFFPINKALWSSSYVLFSSGWACIVLGSVMVAAEFKQNAVFWSFFKTWGQNPILVFFVSGFLGRALNMIKIGEKGLVSFLYEDGISTWFAEPKMASLIGALIYVGIWTLILYKLKKKNLIFKV